MESEDHKNKNGGALVTANQIHQAFAFLDVRQEGKLTIDDLKTRLSIFYPGKQFSLSDYKCLMNQESEITQEYLEQLLLDNEVVDFDPVASAFQMYDPEKTGFIDESVLRQIFENLGFGNLNDADMNLLIEHADSDKDGKISLDDFRSLLYQGEI